MKKVAIIGGGISGLYIANLLRQNPNYETIVYEMNNSINLEKGRIKVMFLFYFLLEILKFLFLEDYKSYLYKLIFP